VVAQRPDTLEFSVKWLYDGWSSCDMLCYVWEGSGLPCLCLLSVGNHSVGNLFFHGKNVCVCVCVCVCVVGTFEAHIAWQQLDIVLGKRLNQTEISTAEWQVCNSKDLNLQTPLTQKTKGICFDYSEKQCIPGTPSTSHKLIRVFKYYGMPPGQCLPKQRWPVHEIRCYCWVHVSTF
jgi:hypothetical protein